MIAINDTNYELWLLRLADGDLSADESAAVRQWLESHPDAQAELQQYTEAPRLQADDAVVYPHPEQLRRQPHSQWSAVLRFAAAAAILAALIVPAVFLLRQPTPAEGPQLAAVTPDVSSVLPEAVDDTVKQLPAPPQSIRPMAVAAPAPSEPQHLVADNAAVEVPQPEADVIISPAPQPEYEESTSLIVVVDDPVVYVNNLIVRDTSTTLSDRLYAANSLLHTTLDAIPGGSNIAAIIPSNQTLERRLVQPVQQRIQRTSVWMGHNAKLIESIINNQ